MLDPRLVKQRLGPPGEETAKQQAQQVYQRQSQAIERTGQKARDRLEADMAALRLHKGTAQEGGYHQAKHGRLVLPVGGGLHDIARDHAIGEHGAGEQQRPHARDHHDPIDAHQHDRDRQQQPGGVGVSVQTLVRRRASGSAAPLRPPPQADAADDHGHTQPLPHAHAERQDAQMSIRFTEKLHNKAKQPVAE